MSEENDSHYLKSVTSLGDKLEIVTSRDIYSKTGIKLASKGSRINSSFYDRLVKHKLMPELDQCMTAENAVASGELLSRAKQLLESEPQLSSLPAQVEIERIWQVLSKIRLADALSFKLTVAREQRPELLDHSLKIALLSLYLGLRCDLSESDLVSLATAAVFHDLGELHISPEILEKRDLSLVERRHIYAHPLIAYLILKEIPEYHPQVSTIVLEHHEYLDGSGYPNGISGDKLSILSQILSIAEVTGGILDQARLEIVLKLNKQKLNTDLIGYVSELFRSRGEPSENKHNLSDIEEKLAYLAQVFDEWDSLYKKSPDSPLFRFANQRILELRHSLFDAGFNPSELDWLTSGIEDDPEGILDVQALIDESCWQIRNLEWEISRLWPDFEKDSGENRLVKEWLANFIRRIAA